jgi:hypothetical protein
VRNLLVTATILAAAVAGCTGGKGSVGGDTGDGVGDPEGDAETVELAGTCDLADRYGGFLVGVFVDEGYSVVDGSVADGVVPITVFEQVAEEGDCLLLKRNNPYCHPSCEGDETCDFDGNCIPYPVDQDMGTVTIAGLANAVTMEPLSPGYTYFDTSLPHPCFEAGDLIELKTSKGTWAPVTLHGVGVTLLEPEDAVWNVYESTDLTLFWDAPTSEVRSHVWLQLNIDQHGASPINVSCEFDDDGEGVVPATLIDALLSAGVTGFPSGSLTRRTVDSATVGDGCMEFIVSSLRTGEVDVYGYTPCFTDKDCPKGQECNKEIQICE